MGAWGVNGPVLLVASPGGHCDQLSEVAADLADSTSKVWVTAPTPQTKALLANETVEWVPYVGSRQLWQAMKSVPRVIQILHTHRPRRVVSTGAALALPHMLAARLRGIPVTYVESATRLTGPSLTGRVLENVPGVDLNHQAESWVKGSSKWRRYGSVFDSYSTVASKNTNASRSMLVTVGSERFDFGRAIDLVLSGAPDATIMWQTGHTEAPGDLPGEVSAWWPGDELAATAKTVDTVVTHAGVGSILMALRAGRCPVVIPRSPQRGEHIDDHQEQLANALESRGLVLVARGDADLAPLIDEASRRQVIRIGSHHMLGPT